MRLIVSLLIAMFLKKIVLANALVNENCEKLDSEIRITKDEYSETGKLFRTCSDEIQVSKCEGYCDSQVQPSIVTSTGFTKECSCCREEFLEERTVYLNNCYDSNGKQFSLLDNSNMAIKIREPTNCKCIKCGFL
ncbi:partner of bursicon [Nasonia vitripennis]|uniref:Partner of bursicon n=1 Tax=Nasonia vitripennis TaxID=7425 RepID=A0A7M7G316_NASVI|nr:partner of bursicon [Nasonia vitripennis]